MRRIHPHLAPWGALVLLVAFLAGGLAVRVLRGPLQDGQRLLGFEARLPGGVDLPLGPPGPEPACIERGEVPAGATLSQVLEHEGVPTDEAQEFLGKLAGLMDLRRVRPRDEYRLLSDRDGSLQRFEFQPDETSYFVVSRDSTGLRAWREEETLQRVYRKVKGVVEGSLYVSMIRQGLDPGLVATFCDVFSCDVDFATETRDGDSFEFLLEQPMKEGRPVGDGRILTGRYRNGDSAHEAFWFCRPGMKGGFYRADGQSLRRAFLKSPLNYTRISSVYSNARRHPIFRTIRPHHGVDYAAPKGTPVVSVADGLVESAGWVNGYGNLLRVRHRSGIVTYYAHLSRFAAGVRSGSRVEQNQVIGYVGMTGNATGPHLDFRIEQAGHFVNPLHFKSTAGEPLLAADRPAFGRSLDGYRQILATLDTGESLPENQFAQLMSGTAPTAAAASPR